MFTNVIDITIDIDNIDIDQIILDYQEMVANSQSIFDPFFQILYDLAIIKICKQILRTQNLNQKLSLRDVNHIVSNNTIKKLSELSDILSKRPINQEQLETYKMTFPIDDQNKINNIIKKVEKIDVLKYDLPNLSDIINCLVILYGTLEFGESFIRRLLTS